MVGVSSEEARAEEDGAGVEANPSQPSHQPTRTDTGPSDGSREVRDGLWSDLDDQDCDDRPVQTTKGDTAEADPLPWGSDPTGGEAAASGRTDGRPDAVFEDEWETKDDSYLVADHLDVLSEAARQWGEDRVTRRLGGRVSLGSTPTPTKRDRGGHWHGYEYPNDTLHSWNVSLDVADEYAEEVPEEVEWSEYVAYQCRDCRADCINRQDSGPAQDRRCRGCSILELDGCFSSPVQKQKPERTVPSDD